MINKSQILIYNQYISQKNTKEYMHNFENHWRYGVAPTPQ